MFTKKKSQPDDSDIDAEGSAESPQKKKKKRINWVPLLKLLKRSMAALFHGLPFVVLLILVGFALLVVWQLIALGEFEGSISYKSGRYAVVEIASQEVEGNLLPPITAVPTSLIPDTQPGVTNPVLDVPDIAVPDEDVKLRPAPNMALVESKDGQFLPKSSADGVMPWEYYARPHTPLPDTKQISVIVTGIGVHNQLSLAAAKLPSAISFSMSPYAPNVNAWIKSMRVQGHECYLDLPMELDNYPLSDPGPSALQPSITPKENAQRLDHLLGKAVGYIGFTIPANEVFFSAPADFIQPVVKNLSERGLALMFAQAKNQPALKETMENEDLVHLGSHVFIPYGSDSVDIRQQLGSAEAIAQQRGHSLVIIEASPVVIDELLIWTKKLRSRGFQLAPASALAKEQFS